MDFSQCAQVFVCRKTGSPIVRKNSAFYNEDDQLVAIDRGGIIDFVDLSVRGGAESVAMVDHYRDLPTQRYDQLLRSQFLMGLMWGVDLKKIPIIEKEVASYPGNYVLDIPCGTAYWGLPAYKLFSDRIFFAVDYSLNMLSAAQQRCRAAGVENVVFVRADVGALPFREALMGGCYSLNGFHAFPSPNKASEEIYRSLLPGGKLLMVTSCAGSRLLSDLVIKYLMLPKGHFLNFWTSQQYSLALQLAGFSALKVDMMGASMICRCQK